MSENLADRIIAFRASNDLSMERFARMCNLTLQTICNIERGLQKPSRLTLQKILNVIGKE